MILLAKRRASLTFWHIESLTSELGHVPNTHVSPYDAAFPGTLPVKSSLNIADNTYIDHRKYSISTSNAWIWL